MFSEYVSLIDDNESFLFFVMVSVIVFVSVVVIIKAIFSRIKNECKSRKTLSENYLKCIDQVKDLQNNYDVLTKSFNILFEAFGRLVDKVETLEQEISTLKD